MKTEVCILPPEESQDEEELYIYCSKHGCTGKRFIHRRDFCAELSISTPPIRSKALSDFVGALGDYIAEQTDEAETEILQVISDYKKRGDLWGPEKKRRNPQGIYILEHSYGFQVCSYFLETDEHGSYPFFFGTTLKVALQEMLQAHRQYEEEKEIFSSEEKILAAIKDAKSLQQVKDLVRKAERH